MSSSLLQMLMNDEPELTQSPPELEPSDYLLIQADHPRVFHMALEYTQSKCRQLDVGVRAPWISIRLESPKAGKKLDKDITKLLNRAEQFLLKGTKFDEGATLGFCMNEHSVSKCSDIRTPLGLIEYHEQSRQHNALATRENRKVQATFLAQCMSYTQSKWIRDWHCFLTANFDEVSSQEWSNIIEQCVEELANAETIGSLKGQPARDLREAFIRHQYANEQVDEKGAHLLARMELDNQLVSAFPFIDPVMHLTQKPQWDVLRQSLSTLLHEKCPNVQMSGFDEMRNWDGEGELPVQSTVRFEGPSEQPGDPVSDVNVRLHPQTIKYMTEEQGSTLSSMIAGAMVSHWQDVHNGRFHAGVTKEWRHRLSQQDVTLKDYQTIVGRHVRRCALPGVEYRPEPQP
ncbi:hypothetical protein AB6D11_00655 [Vibrio splendidus]